MFTIFKRFYRQAFGFPLLLLMFIMLIMSIAERRTFTGDYYFFILQMMTDHYLIVFCMTPIFLLSVFKLFEEIQPIVLIRTRKFFNYFTMKWLAICIFSLAFVTIQIGIIALVASGLPLDNTLTGSPNNAELLLYFEQMFSSPVAALLWSVAFMVIGYSFIGSSLVTLLHFAKRNITLGLILTAYIIMILSIKVPFVSNLPLVTMNRYIILHHNYSGNYGIWWIIIAIAVMTVLQILLIRFAWHSQLEFKMKPRKGIFYYYARILFSRKVWAILIGIITALAIFKGVSGQESFQMYSIRFFYGLDIGEFHIMGMLEQIIYIGAPLYLVAVFIQGWCNDRQLTLLVRIQHKKHWGSSILRNGILFQLLYIISTAAILIVVSIVCNIPFEIEPLFVASIFALKALELLTLFFIFFILFVTIKNVTTAFLCTMSLFIINFLHIPLFRWNIAGLSNVARLHGVENVEGLPLTTSLFVGCVYIIVFFLGAKFTAKQYFKSGW